MAQNFQSFVDNAFAPEAQRLVMLGRRAATAAKAIPQSTGQNIFQVTGRVLIRRLYGVVTTAIQSGTNNANYNSTPTVGTAVDLCTALDIASLQIGGKIVVPALVGSALIKQLAGASNLIACDLLVEAGFIKFATDASKTGSIIHVCFWVPEDPAQASSLVAV